MAWRQKGYLVVKQGCKGAMIGIVKECATRHDAVEAFKSAIGAPNPWPGQKPRFGILEFRMVESVVDPQ